MKPITISVLSKETGVGIETIRYYEKNGVLPKAKRLQSGYRIYDEEAIKRLKFIKHAKSLGFTLKEITGLLNIHSAPGANCHTVKNIALDKIKDVEQKINDLEKIKSTLLKVSNLCPKNAVPLKDCQFLKYFFGD